MDAARRRGRDRLAAGASRGAGAAGRAGRRVVRRGRRGGGGVRPARQQRAGRSSGSTAPGRRAGRRVRRDRHAGRQRRHGARPVVDPGRRARSRGSRRSTAPRCSAAGSTRRTARSFYGRSDVLGVVAVPPGRRSTAPGDVEIAATPIGGVEEAQAGLAIDDTRVHERSGARGSATASGWCTTPRRARSRSVDRGNERMCGLYGIAGDTMVGMTPSCDGRRRRRSPSRSPAAIASCSPTARRALIVPTAGRPPGRPAHHGRHGPRPSASSGSTGPASPGGRDVRARVGLEPLPVGPAPARARLGAARRIARGHPDEPGLCSRAPMLVNLATGERIELPNLPGGDTP